MERNFATYLAENMQQGYVPGDEAAHRAAAALAERADAPTILALTDMLALLERIGGQFYVTSVRIKDSALGPDWHIAGVTFDYETRDAKVERLEPPEEVDGVPVTDSSGPGITVEIERAEDGGELDLTSPYLDDQARAAESAAEDRPDAEESEPEPALSE
jgi:hypothetical protein